MFQKTVIILFTIVILSFPLNGFTAQYENYEWGMSKKEAIKKVRENGYELKIIFTLDKHNEEALTYVDNLFGKNIYVILIFTPMTKKLCAINISSDEISIAKKLKSKLIKKHGDPIKIESKDIYYWGIDREIPDIELRYEDKFIINYYSLKYYPIYEEELYRLGYKEEIKLSKKEKDELNKKKTKIEKPEKIEFNEKPLTELKEKEKPKPVKKEEQELEKKKIEPAEEEIKLKKKEKPKPVKKEKQELEKEKIELSRIEKDKPTQTTFGFEKKENFISEPYKRYEWGMSKQEAIKTIVENGYEIIEIRDFGEDNLNDHILYKWNLLGSDVKINLMFSSISKKLCAIYIIGEETFLNEKLKDILIDQYGPPNHIIPHTNISSWRKNNFTYLILNNNRSQVFHYSEEYWPIYKREKKKLLDKLWKYKYK